MFEDVTEQFGKTLKPYNTLFAVNAKVLEKLVKQQTKLFTDVLNDSVAYTQALSNQKDPFSVFETQKSYVESIQVKVANATKYTQSILTDAQEETGASFKEFWAQSQQAASTATAAATKATKAAK